MDSVGERGKAFNQETVIDLLLEWDRRGYVQLNIPRSQLREKLTEFLAEIGKTPSDEKEEENEGFEKNRSSKEESKKAVSVSGNDGEEKMKDVAEFEDEMKSNERSSVLEYDDGVGIGDWSTPDVTTADSIVIPGEEEERNWLESNKVEQQEANKNEEKKGKCQDEEEVEEEEEEEYYDWSTPDISSACELSIYIPALITDDHQSLEHNLSSITPDEYSPDQSTAYFTAPMSSATVADKSMTIQTTPPPRQSLLTSVYYTAVPTLPPSTTANTSPTTNSPEQVQDSLSPALHSLSSSHHSTPHCSSSSTLDPSSPTSLISPHHSISHSAPTSPTTPPILPPTSLSPAHPSPPPPPSSSTSHSSSPIVLSSDEETADDKLEKLFSEMKIKSERKLAKSLVKKTLTVQIVNDSEEEQENDEDNEEGEDSTSSRSTTNPLSPFTPLSRVSWIDFDDRHESRPRHHHQTVPINRHPLAERNLIPPTEVSARRQPAKKAPPTTTPLQVTTPSAHKSFSRNKMTMARELYDLFNKSVFNNQLPSDLEIIWNSKLRTTAGYCRNSGLMSERKSSIELSTKVIDTYERLKNTLIHEMCHAAVWIVDGIKKGGHQKQWRAWAAKANLVHPDLEPITTCHNYDISYRFHYKCTRCDYTLGRHSKSVNLDEARCPYCLSVLELEGGSTSTTKLNKYAQYVKDHYAEVKLRTPVGGHRAVMENLRKQYHSSTATGPLPKLDFDE